MLRKSLLQVPALVGLMLVFTASGQAQTMGPRAAITQAIDEGRLVTLAGNTRPEAKSQSDLGPVRSDLHLDMYLQLKRSPEQDLAAEQFVESLTDKTSPNFHKWISPAEYGRRFGAASEDIATVSRWLESHGFTVNQVPANSLVIDFSGDAGQVREAFHTEIHTLDAAGKRHFANMSDPQIPAALLPAVTGVVSLNNFMPRPGVRAKSAIHGRLQQLSHRSGRHGDHLQFESGVFRRVYRPGTDHRGGRGFGPLQRHWRLEVLPQDFRAGSVLSRFSYASPPGAREGWRLRRPRNQRRRCRGGHRRRMGQRGRARCRHRHGILRRIRPTSADSSLFRTC